MKLLNLHLLKGCTSKSFGSLSRYQKFNIYYSPIHLKCVRKCWTTTQFRTTADKLKFRYEYDSGELLERLGHLTNTTVISSANNVNIETILKNLNVDKLESKEDVQSLVVSIILAAKFGQNVKTIVEAKALGKFLDLCDAWLYKMTAEDAVSTLIALNLLNVSLHHPVNRRLTTYVTNMLRGNFQHRRNLAKPFNR